jgi:hypothetical protein
MRIACIALAVVAAACGSTTDDRPLTVQYATAAVLAPTCGAAQCHSTFSGNYTDVFDTVVGVRSTIVDTGLVRHDSKPQFDPDMPENADLILWLTQTDPKGRGIGRMPWDAPMPLEDIYYLEKWIAADTPGAQCDPTLDSGLACDNKTLKACNPDWNFGATMMDCPNDCVAGVCQ